MRWFSLHPLKSCWLLSAVCNFWTSASTFRDVSWPPDPGFPSPWHSKKKTCSWPECLMSFDEPVNKQKWGGYSHWLMHGTKKARCPNNKQWPRVKIKKKHTHTKCVYKQNSHFNNQLISFTKWLMKEVFFCVTWVRRRKRRIAVMCRRASSFGSVNYIRLYSPEAAA